MGCYRTEMLLYTLMTRHARVPQKIPGGSGSSVGLRFPMALEFPLGLGFKNKRQVCGYLAGQELFHGRSSEAALYPGGGYKANPGF